MRAAAEKDRTDEETELCSKCSNYLRKTGGLFEQSAQMIMQFVLNTNLLVVGHICLTTKVGTKTSK